MAKPAAPIHHVSIPRHAVQRRRGDGAHAPAPIQPHHSRRAAPIAACKSEIASGQGESEPETIGGNGKNAERPSRERASRHASGREREAGNYHAAVSKTPGERTHGRRAPDGREELRRKQQTRLSVADAPARFEQRRSWTRESW